MTAITERAMKLDASKAYPFVDSTEEHARLTEQTASTNELMLGKNSHAPLTEAPKKILDVGCGTGSETRLLARRYPSATVVGVDINRVPRADDEPENAVFILGRIEDEDVLKHPLLELGTFDLVYCRYLILAIHDWQPHLDLMKSLIAPGGWLEAQELRVWETFDTNGQFVSGDWKSPVVGKRGMRRMGIEPDIATKLPGLCRNLGFEDVSTLAFPITYRDWPARPEADRCGRYAASLQPKFLRMMLERSIGPDDDEDIEELCREMDTEMFGGPPGTHWQHMVITARKPA